MTKFKLLGAFLFGAVFLFSFGLTNAQQFFLVSPSQGGGQSVVPNTVAPSVPVALSPGAATTNVEALKAQIEQLTQYLRELQKRLSEQPTSGGATSPNSLPPSNTSTGACERLTVNLRLGDRGEKVALLQRMLLAQGYQIDAEEDVANEYDESTALAVGRFQAQYASEILTPFGLTSPNSGFVGRLTRNKLNSLYCSSAGSPTAGCGVYGVQVSSPVAGYSYRSGQSLNITWRTLCFDAAWVTVELQGAGDSPLHIYTGDSKGAYNWTIPSTVLSGSKRIFVKARTSNGTVVEGQSGQFNITSSSNQPVAICDYAAPPTGCQYVPGPDYNSNTQCGMILQCGSVNPTSTTSTAPTISIFRVSPSTITAGQSATLEYNTSGGSVITIDQGIGGVFGGYGYRTVSPANTTTYKIRATNSRGQVAEKSVTLNVNSQTGTPTISASFDKDAVNSGAIANLNVSGSGFSTYQLSVTCPIAVQANTKEGSICRNTAPLPNFGRNPDLPNLPITFTTTATTPQIVTIVISLYGASSPSVTKTIIVNPSPSSSQVMNVSADKNSIVSGGTVNFTVTGSGFASFQVSAICPPGVSASSRAAGFCGQTVPNFTSNQILPVFFETSVATPQTVTLSFSPNGQSSPVITKTVVVNFDPAKRTMSTTVDRTSLFSGETVKIGVSGSGYEELELSVNCPSGIAATIYSRSICSVYRLSLPNSITDLPAIFTSSLNSPQSVVLTVRPVGLTSPVVTRTLTINPTAVPAPTISIFRVSPSTITAGQSATLEYNTTGGSVITIDQGIGGVFGGYGYRTVSPANTTTYTIKATNSQGQTTEKSVTLTVNPIVQPTVAACPTLTSPRAGQNYSVTQSGDITFSWPAASGRDTYIVDLTTDPAFSWWWNNGSGAGGGSAQLYASTASIRNSYYSQGRVAPLGILEAGKTYYWRIYGYDSKTNAGCHSEVRSLSVDYLGNVIVGAPNATSPGYGSTILAGSNPTFTWSAGAFSTFILDITTDPNFSWQWNNGSGAGGGSGATSATFSSVKNTYYSNGNPAPLALEAGKTYYWRVYGYNPGSSGMHSPVYMFKVSNLSAETKSMSSDQVASTLSTLQSLVDILKALAAR